MTEIPNDVIKALPLAPVPFFAAMAALGFDRKRARLAFQTALERGEIAIDREMRVAGIEGSR